MTIASLRKIVGDANVVDDPDVAARYCVDWTGRFRGATSAVVRPATTEEVAAIVTTCREGRVAIVPQGGNTGLVGGAVPLDGAIVLSTERMNAVEHVDAVGGQLVAQAGSSLADVQRAAIEAGWTYGVDIAARDSATIGGTVATNAGGLHTVRYGDTRRQLTGVEIVTGDGDIVSSLSGTVRNNTGYDLTQLACGSEGTLGVITRARLRLHAAFPHRATAVLRFEHRRDACVAAESLRRVLPSVESIELFFANGLELVCAAFGVKPPFPTTSGGYVLVEAADVGDPTEQLAAAVDALDGVADVAVAEDSVRRTALWEYRERHTDAIATVGVPHKLDVAVPPGSLADFVAAIPGVVAAAAPNASVYLFGHAGEAAVHVNVVGPSPEDNAVDDAVLQLVADFRGSISAEHGIGRAKVAHLALTYSGAEMRLRRAIKTAFDPDGIMNPGVLFTRA